jgi:hypothetical protein
MSECSEHRGKYLHEAACLKCLSLYWEMQYKAQRTKVAELEALVKDLQKDIRESAHYQDLRLELHNAKNGAATAYNWRCRAETAESRLAEKQSNRDTDWVLALGHAVGLDSGLNVPIIPDPEVVREFLGAYVKTKLADIAELPEKWRWLYEHPSYKALAAVRCADELQAKLDGE